MGKFGDMLLGAGSAGVTSGIAGGISGGLGSLFGMIGQKRRNEIQLEQQRKLNEQAAETNYTWGEKAAESAFSRQMKMYERTYEDESPEARRKQLEEAGLSVGLMYGGGGASGGGMGSTASVPMGATGGASAGKADSPSERRAIELQQMGLGLNMQKLQSEVEVNKSIAEKNEAEAKAATASAGKTETEIGLVNVNIEKATEEIKNYQVQRDSTKLDNILKGIQVEIGERTKELNIEKIEYETGEAEYTVKNLIQRIESQNIDNEIKGRTKETVIKQYNAGLQQTMADIIVKKTQGTVNEAQAKEIAMKTWDYVQNWQIKHEGQKIDREKIATEIEKAGIIKSGMLWSAGINAVGNLLNGVINIATRGLGGMKGGAINEPYKGYPGKTWNSEVPTFND